MCALTGLALGTLVRQTVATTTACVAVLFVLPLVVSDDRYWSAVVAHALPFEAWNRLVTVAPAPTALAVVGTHRRDRRAVANAGEPPAARWGRPTAQPARRPVSRRP
ncbi:MULTISPECIES: hypothetical protein [unclassified Streptomyces]|uniref:hypothetical protein n=1 Tax=unclassified Streptomyces TaxID=2593676 RepID=UPI0024415A60|nr:hypothetical protein [Streptomyces sp. DH41]MDG9725152.1 hypothetical protein [Streptomyces sp. DH41]